MDTSQSPPITFGGIEFTVLQIEKVSIRKNGRFVTIGDKVNTGFEEPNEKNGSLYDRDRDFGFQYPPIENGDRVAIDRCVETLEAELASARKSGDRDGVAGLNRGIRAIKRITGKPKNEPPVSRNPDTGSRSRD